MGIHRRLGGKRRVNIAYFFVAPFFLLFFVFTVWPILFSIVLSFTNFNAVQWPDLVGWNNYKRLLFSDEVFAIAVKNTLLFAVITGPLGYLGSFGFAWLINELSPKVRAVLTLLFYAPTISGNAFMIWAVLFSGDAHGYINGVGMYLGLLDGPVQWLTDPDYMMTIVILAALWMSLGTSFLAFIAGLQGVDRRLYEAGAIDGIKNRWQELWYITLPGMKSYLMFGAVMSITGSFSAAGQITPLVGFPSMDYAAHTIMQHINDYGSIRYEIGYASAIAVVLFVIMVVAQRLVQAALRKLG